MEKKDKKFDWLTVLKITGALVTVAGVAFSLVVGSMYGNTKKIFGMFTMPLFGWIVALAGFILFYWSRSKQVDKFEKEQQTEFEKQMREQNEQKQLKEIQELAQQQKKLPKRGLVVLIKKKELVERKAVKTEIQENKVETKESKQADNAVQDNIVKDKKTKKENKKDKLPKENKQVEASEKNDGKDDLLDKFIDHEDVITSKKSKKKEK